MATLITTKDNETAFIEAFERLMLWEVKCYALWSGGGNNDAFFQYPTCCEWPNNGKGDERVARPRSGLLVSQTASLIRLKRVLRLVNVL
ncbi:hypothetical protein Ddc_18022 [Ditylenchus destructor]|nr:hypothetical protein Ddc_18022 [Ditylenchus destructor]